MPLCVLFMFKSYLGRRRSETKLGSWCRAQFAQPAGKTPLDISIEKNCIEIALMLIKAGADVNLPSLVKVSPLITTTYAGSLPFVDLLLKAKHPDIAALLQ